MRPKTLLRDFLILTDAVEAFRVAFDRTSRYRGQITADYFIDNYQNYATDNPLDVSLHWAATTQGATYWSNKNEMFYSLVSGSSRSREIWNNKGGFRYAEL